MTRHAIFALIAAAALSLGACAASSAVQGSSELDDPGDVEGVQSDSEAPAGNEAAEEEGVEVLNIDESRSMVSFVGSRDKMSHLRTFARFGGEVTLKEGELTGVWVSLNVKSLIHGDDALSKHLLSKDFFNTARFPSAGFKSTQVLAERDGDFTHKITGVLEVRGIKRTITFPAKVALDEAGFFGEATLILNRQDFGLDFPGPPSDPIYDEVPLLLRVVCDRPGGAG